VNSFAITLAMVAPGSRIEVGIRFVFPMTIVTAIVSPSARPSARITAPRIPGLAASRATAIDSAWVAPSASDASRSVFGVARSTSREMETTVGTTMMPRMIPAFRMPIPKGAPLKRGMNPRFAMSHGSIVERRKGARMKKPQMP
jgi:hypothetical protein